MQNTNVSIAFVPTGENGNGPICWISSLFEQEREIKIVAVASPTREGMMPILEHHVARLKDSQGIAKKNRDVIAKAILRAKQRESSVLDLSVFRHLRDHINDWMFDNEMWPMLLLKKKDILYVENL